MKNQRDFVNNPKKLPKYITETKVKEVLELARNKNKKDYLMLLTLWRTGIRNDELTKLKKQDIKSDELMVRQGKGHKDRLVPLEPHLYDLLAYYMADLNLEDRLFPFSTTWIRQIVHRYQGDQVITPHTFRHSFAVHCLKGGMNIRSLQKIMGHKNLSTTAIYLDLIGKDIKEDFKKVVWD